MSFGKELILDVADVRPDIKLLNDKAYLRLFIKDLLETINMKPWGRTKFQRLIDCPDHLSGTSFVQFLHTSSLTCHICDKSKTLYLNLFSCGPYRWEDVVEVVSRYFGGETISMTVVDRRNADGFDD